MSIVFFSLGKNIFDVLDTEMSARGIPWANCIAFGCDNANVMVGSKKGVFAYIKEQPGCNKLFLAGCTLHLVHLGAKKGN